FPSLSPWFTVIFMPTDSTLFSMVAICLPPELFFVFGVLPYTYTIRFRGTKRAYSFLKNKD
ncbi:hypothetical protein, partial [Eubacterium maltosivorans]|uniref:hypothetical protein n=1 Tax=Eubacterium maltosivorans TaxID=2041044 RepID=UPI001A9AB601